jgi:CRP-like cAMP-binding protein
LEEENIYKAFNDISPLTAEAWAHLRTLLEPLKLQRNDYLVREGSRVTHCFFLTDGVIRVYYNKDGNEYNKTFFIPGMFPTPLTALLSDAPSALSFQALVPCQLVRFTYQGFRNAFDTHRSLEQLLLKILEQEWIAKERHDIQMVTNDATSNYIIFRVRYPDLEKMIPQYHIASYLGITPIQLSRIRRKLVKTH